MQPLSSEREVVRLVQRLQREVRVGRLMLLLAAAALLLFPGRVLQADSDGKELRVRRLVIVDEKGTERIVLGSPVGGPVVEGVRHQRRSPQTGMIINDADGNERSGYGLSDDGVVHLGLDSDTGERVSLLFWPGVGSGLLVRGENGRQRAAFGITSKQGDSSVVLNAADGSIRLRLRVTPDGTATITLNDAAGNPVLTLPQ